jgi:sugar lactone lactonase YvrE
MNTQGNLDRVGIMKRFYEVNIIKQIETNKISAPISMCSDRNRDIYVSCNKTNNIIVYDKELNEQRSFKAGISPASLAVTDKFVIVADANTGKMALYEGEGHCVWQKHAADIDPSLRMPSIGVFNDGTLWLIDLLSNVIYELTVSREGNVTLSEKCHVQKERFYDPVTRHWPLRGLLKNEGDVYTCFNNAIHMIDQNGILQEKIILPLPLMSVMGIGWVKDSLYVLDNKLNIILKCAIDGASIKKFKTINFDREDGIVNRILVCDEAIYFCKKRKDQSAVIGKIAL